MKKVIVLMSTYNGENYLDKQISSILNQKKVEVSLLVRDDGSTDGTINLLNRYQDENKLKWFTGKNMGPANSFFELVKKADVADFYAFSDQDDLWDDDKLSIAVECLKEDQVPAMYHCNARLIDSYDQEMDDCVNNHCSELIFKKEHFLSEFCSGGGAMGCTMVMNQMLVAILKHYGTPDKVIMHDCFIHSMCMSVGGNVYYDGIPHMGYRQHMNNVIGKKKGMLQALKYRIDFIIKPHKASIADHAKAILDLYREKVSEDRLKELLLISKYKDNLITRYRLAFSPNLVYENAKDMIFFKITLILGKR